IGDLRAETIHMVVVAVDSHDARAVNGGVENFRGLKIGGNEHASVETLLSGLRRDGVGQIAGGRAADSFEFKAARGGQGRCDNTILEGKRRETDRVVLDVEVLYAEFFRKMARGNERRAANGIGRAEIFGQRKKFRVTPHVKGA